LIFMNVLALAACFGTLLLFLVQPTAGRLNI
jgi:hypothetical protein